MMVAGLKLNFAAFGQPDRYGLSLTLGGGEVRLLDMTLAYSVFANDGLKVDPVAVLAVSNAAGTVIYHDLSQSGELVLDPFGGSGTTLAE